MKQMLLILVSVLWVGCFDGAAAEVGRQAAGSAQFEELQLAGNGGGAAYFPGTAKKAVIFSPGSRYDKESWYFLAERFQKLNIASLALDNGSTQGILQAIALLKEKGFEKISLVGGSMGGEAILGVVEVDADQSIDKIVVLAPFGGNPLKSGKIDKLFIVAKRDGMLSYTNVESLYHNSSEPKRFKLYEQSGAHGQELFSSKRTKDDVISLIIDFINA